LQISTPGRPHLLHVFPTFAVGGAQARTVGIINALGDEFQHSILALDDRWDAAQRIDPRFGVHLLQPPQTKNPLRRPIALRRILVRSAPDLLVTYNWGATEALLAAWSGLHLPAIHNEDGFGADEAHGLKRRRVLARRVLLRPAFATVVPSQTLRRIATEEYRLPESKVRFIVNGVDLSRFHSTGDRSLRTRLPADEDAVVFGTVAQLRREKGLDALIRAFAGADIPNAKLVIVGDGPCRGELEELVRCLQLTERVCFPGSTDDPVPYLRALDVFVMASRTEQTPISLLEAMACGLPAVCTDVGDTALLLGTKDRPVLVPLDQPKAYADALRQLARSAELRRELGTRNRLRCEQNYSFSRMLDAYRKLYCDALSAGVRRYHSTNRSTPSSKEITGW
jgi:glycosyltransferase involved in cell wall biosynthesis